MIVILSLYVEFGKSLCKSFDCEVQRTKGLEGEFSISTVSSLSSEISKTSNLLVISVTYLSQSNIFFLFVTLFGLFLLTLKDSFLTTGDVFILKKFCGTLFGVGIKK